MENELPPTPKTNIEPNQNEIDPYILQRNREEVEQLLASPSPDAVADYLEVLGRRESQLLEKINQALRDSLNPEAWSKLPFNERLMECIKAAQKHGGRLTLVRADLDYFKQLNDALGHGAGDQALAAASNTLLQSTYDVLSKTFKRNTDTIADLGRNSILAHDFSRNPDEPMVAREGGDEFAIILPGTSQYQALQIARKGQVEFQNQIQSRFGSQVATGMTLGIAGINFALENLTGSPEEIATELKTRADLALYAAKELSRGSIEIYDPKNPRIAARQLNHHK